MAGNPYAPSYQPAIEDMQRIRNQRVGNMGTYSDLDAQSSTGFYGSLAPGQSAQQAIAQRNANLQSQSDQAWEGRYNTFWSQYDQSPSSATAPAGSPMPSSTIPNLGAGLVASAPASASAFTNPNFTNGIGVSAGPAGSTTGGTDGSAIGSGFTPTNITETPGWQQLLQGFYNQNPYVGMAAFQQQLAGGNSGLNGGAMPWQPYGRYLNSLAPDLNNQFQAYTAQHPDDNASFLTYLNQINPQLQTTYQMMMPSLVRPLQQRRYI